MQIVLFNKPFQTLSQFTDPEGRSTLAEYLDHPGYRVAGRLDYDSEGLLLLTNNGELQDRICSPASKMQKCYWVLVEGEPQDRQLRALRAGVEIRSGKTAPAKASRLEPPTSLWEREPPVTAHRQQRAHWLEITVAEGKNRQVRRMCAAVGLPVLRLVRTSIGHWRLDNLAPGESRLETVHLPAH